MKNETLGPSYFEKKSLVERMLQLPEDFFLEEDEDFLRLKFKDEVIGRYSTDGVTSEKLREEIEDAIEKYQKDGSVNPDIRI